MKKATRKKNPEVELDLEPYFKIGVSREFILLRDDCPVSEIPPGVFAKVLKEMFTRNEEVLNHAE